MRILLGLLALGAGVALAVSAAAHSANQSSVLSTPPLVTPPLGAADRVFPVYGNAFPSGTFGAGRSDVPGGWHHGDDIFAPLGTPVLACADGTVFSVGWNKIGGWRLWLVDGEGNEFYYAHLSKYSAYAVDGAIVHAGDVLGYVGDTGDAEGTPYHLHFEVHPVSLLPLGYDGAVDPDPYLVTWRRVKSLTWQAAAGWSHVSARTAASALTAEPGAILLSARDISSANGLDPASLARIVDAAP
ncbi:MAG TPA: M23 family metallopeptidase [Gaiellaceae bacterium]|nr:M23 family metallopeptidase [Gaiellaceae bacterium]